MASLLLSGRFHHLTVVTANSVGFIIICLSPEDVVTRYYTKIVFRWIPCYGDIIFSDIGLFYGWSFIGNFGECLGRAVLAESAPTISAVHIGDRNCNGRDRVMNKDVYYIIMSKLCIVDCIINLSLTIRQTSNGLKDQYSQAYDHVHATKNQISLPI